MTHPQSRILTLALTILMTILISVSCATAPEGSVEVSSAQMWTENCSRCHGVRDPGSLSDSQWTVAMRHMRIRGGLTAEEHDGILEFLQASN